MFVGRFFAIFTSFLVGIYIARYLGPSNYGLLNYVTSFVGLFVFLAYFGIDSIVSRELVKNPEKKDTLIGTGFYIKLAGSILAILSIFLISFFITEDLFTLSLIWLFSLSFIPQAFNIIEIYFQSQVLSKNIVLAQIISNLISAILKILCIMIGKGIFWLIVIYIIEASLYAGILLFSFRKFGNHLRTWRFEFPIARYILKDAWPLMFSTVALSIYMKIDQVMIKNMLGNEGAGIYAVAAKLSEVWYVIPMVICASVSPAIIKAAKVSTQLFEQRIRKLYFFMFWLAFFVASVITIFAYPIIQTLFGSTYLSAVPVLQIYVWAGIAISMGYAINQYLLAHNLTKITFYNNVLGALLNVILNIILIPKMGISGAAIATLVSYIVAIFGVFLFKESRAQGYLVLKSIINRT
jgi:O-antigen/teichoic acid export membrane protein